MLCVCERRSSMFLILINSIWPTWCCVGLNVEVGYKHNVERAGQSNNGQDGCISLATFFRDKITGIAELNGKSAERGHRTLKHIIPKQCDTWMDDVSCPHRDSGRFHHNTRSLPVGPSDARNGVGKRYYSSKNDRMHVLKKVRHKQKSWSKGQKGWCAKRVVIIQA